MGCAWRRGTALPGRPGTAPGERWKCRAWQVGELGGLGAWDRLCGGRRSAVTRAREHERMKGLEAARCAAVMLRFAKKNASTQPCLLLHSLADRGCAFGATTRPASHLRPGCASCLWLAARRAAARVRSTCSCRGALPACRPPATLDCCRRRPAAAAHRLAPLPHTLPLLHQAAQPWMNGGQPAE